MLAFAGKPNDAEIDDILVFIQVKWPQLLYEAWYRANERLRKVNLNKYF